MRKDKLTEDEIEDLNEVSGTDFLVNKVNPIELMKHKVSLLKTLTSMSEFVKIWGAEREERKKQFFAALDVKPLTQEEIDRFLNKNKQQNSNSIQKSNESTQNLENKKPFKPIQGESKNKETYKDNNISHEFLKKLLKNSFNQAKELEILLGMKMSDEEGELNSFLSQKNLQSVKSVDIKV